LYELVIYTPTVEAGVSYDLKDFYKKYMCLCDRSCTPRALSQMTARFREIICANVLVWLNGMPYRTKANFYTYDEVKEYVYEMYKYYINAKRKYDKDNDKYYQTYNLDPRDAVYVKILIHNELEKLNAQRYYFVAYFIKILEEKGCTYELLDIPKDKEKKKLTKKEVLSQHKIDIINARDITEDDYEKLLSKQAKDKTTLEDKLAIEKHLYKKHFKVKTIDETFIDKYYNKFHVLSNLKFITGKRDIDPYFTNAETGIVQLKFDKLKVLERIRILKQLIKMLGFNINSIGNVLLSMEDFDNNIKFCKHNTILFTDPNRSKPLFGLHKMKLKSRISLIRFINNLLADWGLKVKSITKTERIKGTSKFKKKSYYKLTYIEDYYIYR
jgi:hypothetical protein